MRPLPARAALPLALVAAVLALSGCAPAATSADPATTPEPTCVLPAQPGVEPPPGCTTYDPEANMNANEMYRERLDISDAAQAAGGDAAGRATAELEKLRASGSEVTADAVRSALADAGLSADGIQTREEGGSVLFGATFSSPADDMASCVYGSVSAGSVSVEVGGLIMDGGCLPAQ
jgi:hypothetical protein